MLYLLLFIYVLIHFLKIVWLTEKKVFTKGKTPILLN